MKSVMRIVIALVLFIGIAVGTYHLSSAQQASAQTQENAASSPGFDAVVQNDPEGMTKKGQEIFRFDTFRDEAFWGDTLKLHQAIEGAKLGGVGPGVSPATALAVGLKVDVDALPASLIAALKGGKVNLNDPATTLALLKLNSVVGLTGHFNSQGQLSSMGIQMGKPGPERRSDYFSCTKLILLLICLASMSPQ